MATQKCLCGLVPILVLAVSFSLLMLSCFCEASREETNPRTHVRESYEFDREAYPTYFGGRGDGRFGSSVKPRDDVLSLKTFGRPSLPKSPRMTVSVSDFGAKGDGKTDDTQAFETAWKKACSSSNGAVLLIPRGKSYLLKPIRFSGPCKSALTIQIYGTLEASETPSDYNEDSNHWLAFDGVDNLAVDGGGTGTVDGNGKIWWQNSCKVNKAKPCKDAPTALTFYNGKNVRLNNLKIRDAQQIHTSFEKCTNVQVSNVVVTAPADSPNTDGIHVTGTQNIQITSSIIGTGDDCISIVSGSQNVQIKDITCGPGHGISIGSLGEDNSKAYVSGVTVNGAKLSGTENGLRIKTWQGGSGSVSNIKFQNIQMSNVKNPIIIDQNYCDQKTPCKQQNSAVQVKNVVYQNIKGTSASDVAIKFDCSKSYPCQGLVLQNVNISGGKASCNNAKVTDQGTIFPQCM